MQPRPSRIPSPRPRLSAVAPGQRAPRAPLEAAALIAVLALGVYVRVDDLESWRAQAELAFHQGLPLLANADGYFFLALARDLVQDTYAPVDALRAAPLGAARPDPPPLLSLLTAGIGRVTGAPLDWVAVLLPAALGPLAALPVYAIARRLEGAVAGLSAALVTVLSHDYVLRTTVGFYDTDCLNVTLVLAMAWWSLALANAPGERFLAWLTAGVALYLVFLWWWFGAHPVVTAVAAWSLLCALLSPRRSAAERVSAVAVCVGLALAALWWRGAGVATRFVDHLRGAISHVSKAEQGEFPNIAVSIGEQRASALSDVAQQLVGDAWLLALAASGLLWLLVAHRRAVPVLLVPLALSAMGVLFAQRFVMFGAPLAALGIGMLVARASRAAGSRRALQGLVALGALLAVGPSWTRNADAVVMPLANAELVSGMRWLAEQTPRDAVVWAKWDFGYTLRYFSERATVNDGSVHTGELTVYNTLPFAAASFRQAANFMQFYSVHGPPGLRRLYAAAGGAAPGLELARRVFEAGPQRARPLLAAAELSPFDDREGAEPWLRFLFPPDPPPLYLLNDQRLLGTARWWFGFGTWHVAAREGEAARLEPFYGLRRDADIVAGEGITVDLAQGVATTRDGLHPIARALLATGGRLEQRRYPHDADTEFSFSGHGGLGALQSPGVARSVFSKTFILKLAAPRYFRPALPQWSGTFQLWEVTGDRRVVE